MTTTRPLDVTELPRLPEQWEWQNWGSDGRPEWAAVNTVSRSYWCTVNPNGTIASDSFSQGGIPIDVVFATIFANGFAKEVIKSIHMSLFNVATQELCDLPGVIDVQVNGSTIVVIVESLIEVDWTAIVKAEDAIARQHDDFNFNISVRQRTNKDGITAV